MTALATLWNRFGQSIDTRRHRATRNHTEMIAGPDGGARLVVAHRDPGVPNWLDTMSRPLALLNFRYFWGSTLPAIETRVVPVSEVRAALSADTPTVDAATRAQEVRDRRDHLAWRYRV